MSLRSDVSPPEVRTRRDALRKLLKASAELVAAPDDDQLLPRVLEMSRIVTADAHALWRFIARERQWGIVAQHGLSAEQQSIRLPSAAVEEMARQGVVFHDIGELPKSAGDMGEVCRRDGLRSLMVAPLNLSGNLSGFIAYYSRDAAAFGPEEEDLAKGLANLASAAITAADLLEQRKKSRADVELAKSRSEFMAEASGLLGASLDYHTTFASVARLVVPQIADWCVLDVMGPSGMLDRVVVIHSDPAKIELANELQRRYPPDPERSLGLGRALNGQSEFLPEVKESMLSMVAQDKDHLGILRQLGIRSAMIVPLMARGKVIGMLSLISAESKRRFTRADLAMAEELASRAAMAVDNARLYRDAQEAGARVQESFALLDTLLETAPIGLGFLDTHFRFLRVNRTLAEINGVKLGDHIGRSLEDVVPSMWPGLKPHLERVLKTGRPVQDVELKGETNARPGDVRDWMVSYYPVRAEDKTFGIGVIVSDVTDRKRAFRAVEESEAKFRAVTETVATAIYIHDGQRLLYVNRAVEEVTGYSREELMALDMWHIVHPEFRRLVEQRARERLSASVSPMPRYEYKIIRKDGQERWLDFSATVVQFEGKRAVLGTAFDITDRKLAEEALRNSEKLAATGRLAATIAHEINNPLEAVTNLLYLLEKDNGLQGGARQFVGLAQQELSRVGHIVKQTLGFYRDTMLPVKLRLSDVLDSVLELYERKIHLNQVKVVKHYRSPGTVTAFSGEMRQVFSNLISNALEAMEDGGNLGLKVSHGRDWSSERSGVRVTIIDSGGGISQKNRNRIFEPFFTTKGEKGTGLGLWVTHGIVEKHGGKIRMRTWTEDEKKGTCFSIFLPEDAASDLRVA